MYGDFRKRILIVGENRRDVRDWLGLLLVADIVAMPVEDVDSVLSTTFDVVYKLLVDICEYDAGTSLGEDGAYKAATNVACAEMESDGLDGMGAKGRVRSAGGRISRCHIWMFICSSAGVIWTEVGVRAGLPK